jgi:hypothetical protein
MRNWFLKLYDRLFSNVSFGYRDRDGKRRICRLAPHRLTQFYDDPMTHASGVDVGEFVNDWRKQDLRNGCPYCRTEVLENASEPDVMQRWELRR